MKQRILISIAVAFVLVAASIISYLWRVFRISQANKTDQERLENGEQPQDD